MSVGLAVFGSSLGLPLQWVKGAVCVVSLHCKDGVQSFVFSPVLEHFDQIYGKIAETSLAVKGSAGLSCSLLAACDTG